MGVLADLTANAKTIDFATTRDGKHRITVRDLTTLQDTIGDPAYPTGFAVTDQVDSIAIYDGTVSGGTFAVSITLKGVAAFTTAAIAFNANAATIQTAIDVAATAAAVPGWTNGDIVVAGGALTTTPVTLTYSGAAVLGTKHTVVSIDGALLTGGGTAGDSSITTNGQTNRTAWATLAVAGAISGTPPVQGTSAAVTAVANYNNNSAAFRLEQDTLRALADEAAVEDESDDVRTEILAALGIR